MVKHTPWSNLDIDAVLKQKKLQEEIRKYLYPPVLKPWDKSKSAKKKNTKGSAIRAAATLFNDNAMYHESEGDYSISHVETMNYFHAFETRKGNEGRGFYLVPSWLMWKNIIDQLAEITIDLQNIADMDTHITVLDEKYGWSEIVSNLHWYDGRVGFYGFVGCGMYSGAVVSRHNILDSNEDFVSGTYPSYITDAPITDTPIQLLLKQGYLKFTPHMLEIDVAPKAK